jgi:hypothetical protein
MGITLTMNKGPRQTEGEAGKDGGHVIARRTDGGDL